MSSWDGMRVLVTGCTGFVGAWLCDELLRDGAEVTGLVWPSASMAAYERLSLPERIREVPGDINDGVLLRSVLHDGEIDAVFHLAAQAIVTQANQSPTETYDVNVRGTWTLLDAIREAAPAVRRIVVATSDKVYGDQPVLPYSEQTPLGAVHPYDVSKACADLVATSYAKSFGMPVAIIRCGNIYGGGDLNMGRLIPGTIRSILAGERPFIRSDGTLTRDYVHVQDVQRAYVRTAEALDQPRFRGEAFNFGNERPVSVLEVVELILQYLGRPDLRPVIGNVASGEILHQWLQSSKARRELCWEPAVSLEEGLRETVAWYQDFFRTDAGREWVGAGEELLR